MTNYFNYQPKFNGVFSSNNLPIIKDVVYALISQTKIVKEHIGFHFLLTETRLFTLTLLELNIFTRIY